jgi:hypothetical protein
MSLSFTKSVLVAGLLAAGTSFSPAAAQSAPNGYSYQLVTTIESVVPGGFGRSKISYTPAYKGIKEAPMENLFSLTGLNLANLQKNEDAIVTLTQQMANDGYELVQALPLTSSIQGSGIFMTRYMFRKAK